jgi:hypothetical protein
MTFSRGGNHAVRGRWCQGPLVSPRETCACDLQSPTLASCILIRRETIVCFACGLGFNDQAELVIIEDLKMNFTTIDVTPALEAILDRDAKLFEKAPDAQKASLSTQIREKMLAEIKRQGKIHISEQTAAKNLVERKVKSALLALKDASGAFSDLKKLKNKPKSDAHAAPILEVLCGTSRDSLATLLEAAMAEQAGAETSYNAVKNLLRD